MTLIFLRAGAPYIVGLVFAACGCATSFAATTDDDAARSGRYFADLGWRTPAGVANALAAAERVLAADPDAEIEFLVHGKDMRLFIAGAARRNPRIVAQSERLAAQGQVSFRVCEHALSFKGKTLGSFPRHFGVVDYVPERVQQLRASGYEDLHAPP